VPEGYTIVVKMHFEIQVRKNGVVEIATKSKAGAVTKTAKATFTVERKNNFFTPSSQDLHLKPFL
jgi:hypothetical protein